MFGFYLYLNTHHPLCLYNDLSGQSGCPGYWLIYFQFLSTIPPQSLCAIFVSNPYETSNNRLAISVCVFSHRLRWSLAYLIPCLPSLAYLIPCLPTLDAGHSYVCMAGKLLGFIWRSHPAQCLDIVQSPPWWHGIEPFTAVLVLGEEIQLVTGRIPSQSSSNARRQCYLWH